MIRMNQDFSLGDFQKRLMFPYPVYTETTV